MMEDPIVAEVRKVREAHAAQFNYDLEAIYRDLKRQEKESGRTFVSYPPRRAKPAGKADTRREAVA
ncbi:MAG TPA: hypothetical protein VKE24_03820 [Candidatus Acidoferrales bacterium]|nr:hypothetical protein [Candidatus Acidoferrales bacterium]